MPMSDFLKELLARFPWGPAGREAGTLSESALDHLDWRVREAAAAGPLRSLETGAGLTTSLLAHYARWHSVYTNGRQDTVLASDDLPAENISWIEGPVARTMLAQPPREGLDIAILGGADGYPAADLAFAAIREQLKPGALLVISDIRIPTIHHLYRFLLEDEAFRLDKVAVTTAFFHYQPRAETMGLAAAWWQQRYNAQLFPAFETGALEVGASLPVRLAFDGVLHHRAPNFLRGFALENGRPVSEGRESHLTLKFAEPQTGRRHIVVELEPMAVAARRQAGLAPRVAIRVGTWEAAAIRFEDDRRLAVAFSLDLQAEERLDLVFHHHGLPVAERSGDGRQRNVRLHAFEVSAQRVDAPVNLVRRVDGSLVSFDHGGQRFCFFVDDLGDSVQNFHVHGRFYELEDLEALRSFVDDRPRILEVGAHVGNHTVYFSHFFDAAIVVPVEPNPRSQAILRLNCQLNRCENVDLGRVDHALGAQAGRGRVVPVTDHNSGGAMVEPGDAGPVAIIRGDDLFAGEDFDLVKIDVEGMELEVLAGLGGLIERCRPLLFIEVRDDNETALERLLASWHYRIMRRSRMYEGLTNVVARFEEKAEQSPPRRFGWVFGR
ncbi:FkbM family methyltransferase [Labrys sp. KNU-23]|uniref:FkbM family methyltransferase n=1 Tax=Labrys sp. KNU-23 TaxID=2789216 RepID=UPI0011ED885A|nr:FkbM family methyltransferase [Labrys sp. KNU-23]QEN85402.1 FkbM family methyltransferase [Labrys sp. KNU-23]